MRMARSTTALALACIFLACGERDTEPPAGANRVSPEPAVSDAQAAAGLAPDDAAAALIAAEAKRSAGFAPPPPPLFPRQARKATQVRREKKGPLAF